MRSTSGLLILGGQEQHECANDNMIFASIICRYSVLIYIYIFSYSYVKQTQIILHTMLFFGYVYRICFSVVVARGFLLKACPMESQNLDGDCKHGARQPMCLLSIWLACPLWWKHVSRTQNIIVCDVPIILGQPCATYCCKIDIYIMTYRSIYHQSTAPFCVSALFEHEPHQPQGFKLTSGQHT